MFNINLRAYFANKVKRNYHSNTRNGSQNDKYFYVSIFMGFIFEPNTTFL